MRVVLLRPRSLVRFRLHQTALDSLCESFVVFIFGDQNLPVTALKHVPGSSTPSAKMRGFHRPTLKAIYSPGPASTGHDVPPSPVVAIVLASFDRLDFGKSSDALTDWLNARWAKSQYQISPEVVTFILRSNGRDATRGFGDHLDGAFCRGPRERT